MFLFQVFSQKQEEKKDKQQRENQQQLKESEQKAQSFYKEFFNIVAPAIGKKTENLANYIKFEEAMKRLKKENPEEYRKILKIIDEFKEEILGYIKVNKNDYLLSESLFNLIHKIKDNYYNLVVLKQRAKENRLEKDYQNFVNELVKSDNYTAGKRIEELLKTSPFNLAIELNKKIK